MELGHSKTTDTILRFIGNEKRYEIEHFIDEVKDQKFMEIESQESLENVFKDNIDEFLSKVTQDELLDLRSYTG